MNFEKALEEIKNGKRVSRKGWNENEWIMKVNSSSLPWRGIGKIDTLPWIGMRTIDARYIPWTATHIDLLANDWYMFEDL
jgi:hypothetical protein